MQSFILILLFMQVNNQMPLLITNMLSVTNNNFVGLISEVGTSNIISKVQRNKAQRSFQPVKAQRKLRNLFFLISEAQRNFRSELFDSVDAQRNSAIAERHFRTKLKRNLTSAIEISQHRANTALFAIFDRKE